VALTVSQINTHKIRGATTVVVAEDHPALRGTASKAPSDNPHYRWVYVALPRTGDTLLTVFSATVVLQRLALKMSLRKAAYLDHLGIPDHGVHPDVPKNVSKSITVD
jgi:glucosamine--fructose-6-phosphate aminotransferase (isomerizing)